MESSKKIAAILATLAVGVSTSLHAEAFDHPDVSAMAYVSWSFGSVAPQGAPMLLGLEVTRTLRNQWRDPVFHSPSLQRESLNTVIPLVDIRFNPKIKEWQTFRVGGFDALSHGARLNADGAGATEAAGFSMSTIVTGAVLAVVAIAAATKKKGGGKSTESSSNNDPTFETPPAPQ